MGFLYLDKGKDLWFPLKPTTNLSPTQIVVGWSGYPVWQLKQLGHGKDVLIPQGHPTPRSWFRKVVQLCQPIHLPTVTLPQSPTEGSWSHHFKHCTAWDAGNTLLVFVRKVLTSSACFISWGGKGLYLIHHLGRHSMGELTTPLRGTVRTIKGQRSLEAKYWEDQDSRWTVWKNIVCHVTRLA